MNNLFVSLYDKDEKESLKELLENKMDYYKYIFFKYNLSKDILNNEFGKNINLKLDYEYILDNMLTKKDTLKILNMKQKLKKEFSNLSNINVIFDKYFDNLDTKNKEYIKQYIFEILNVSDEIHINEIMSQNNMNENDIKYIEEFIEMSKVNKNKLKILLILNDIKDYKDEKVREYITKYKYVDILKMPNITKTQYKDILSSIESINEEYGSTISIIQKRNIQEYHILIMYSKVSYEYFSTHFILRKKSKYIDMKDEDFDKYNVNICEYEKNKSYMLTLSSRLNMDLSRYSKNKIGKAIIGK